MRFCMRRAICLAKSRVDEGALGAALLLPCRCEGAAITGDGARTVDTIVDVVAVARGEGRAAGVVVVVEGVAATAGEERATEMGNAGGEAYAAMMGGSSVGDALLWTVLVAIAMDCGCEGGTAGFAVSVEEVRAGFAAGEILVRAEDVSNAYLALADATSKFLSSLEATLTN